MYDKLMYIPNEANKITPSFDYGLKRLDITSNLNSIKVPSE